MKIFLPANEELRNFFPFVAVEAMGFEDNVFFLLGPAFLVNERVKVIVPSGLVEVYLSLHCFPDLLRPEAYYGSFYAMTVHFLLPCCSISFKMASSS